MRLLAPLALLAPLLACAQAPHRRLTGESERASVTFHVLGFLKTPSGATWRAWPDEVTESLEGAHPSARVEWKYDEDLVTIAFGRGETSEEELEREIEALGYEVEASSPKSDGAVAPALSETFALPEDAPAFFREAVERARGAGKPLVIDFWAPWCAPCVKLRRETLDSPALAPLLEKFVVIAVDLDENPALGTFYGISSIPYVVFVDPKGNVVDRLFGFEPPAPFEKRLEKALP